MTVQQFLQQSKQKAEATAKKMNALELSIWDSNHEWELRQHFGFTNKQLAQRKKQLSNSVGAC